MKIIKSLKALPGKISEKITELYLKLKKADRKHYIAAGIILLSLIIVIVFFPLSFGRLWDSFIYLLSCLKYYFVKLFSETGTIITPPTMPQIGTGSSGDVLIPKDISEFVYLFRSWAVSLTNKDVFLTYIVEVILFIMEIAKVVLLIPFFLIVFLLFKKYYFMPGKLEDGEDTDSLKFYKEKIEAKIIFPVKRWMTRFWSFLKENKRYIILFILIYCLGLDLISMATQIVSWYIYFIMSFDFASLSNPLISVAHVMVPIFYYLKAPGVCFIIVIIFLIIRKMDAIELLKAMQTKNEEFLNDLGVATIIKGPPGVGKTKMMTSIGIDVEKQFREKAFDIIKKYNNMFPYFPWNRFEKYIIESVESRKFVNRSQIKSDAKKRWAAFTLSQFADANKIFDYDIKNYSIIYFDGIKIVSLGDALTSYGQAFFLYNMPKPLAVANYSIRFDVVKKGKKGKKTFFPQYDYDYFKRDNRLMADFSKYATIANFDARRLMMKKNATDDKRWFMLDGVVEVYTEIDKERGNKDDHVGMSKMDNTANQTNDGFNRSIKITRHEYTIDGFPFTKLLFDTQRESSVNADLRETCENKILIRDCSDLQISLALFFIDYAFYKYLIKPWEDFHFNFRNKRNKNTLPNHLLKAIIHVIFTIYDREINRYSYETISYSQEIGGSIDEAGDKSLGNYYVITRKMRANTYETACYSDLFDQNRQKALFGFCDAPTYVSHVASYKELNSQESYWIDDLIVYTMTKDPISAIVYAPKTKVVDDGIVMAK